MPIGSSRSDASPPLKATAISALRIGEWRVDPALDEISRDGITVKLEPRAMQLLLYLAERPGEVVSVEQLLDRVWAGVVVTPDSVYHAIAALRRVLGDDTREPRYIANVPRRGYRLVAPVTTQTAAPNKPTPRSNTTAQTLATFALVALIIVGAGYFAFDRLTRSSGGPSASAASGESSIAVLPFVDMSEKHDQEYFAAGLAQELVDVLGKIPNLRVVSHGSSFQFRNKAGDLRDVGAQLGVAYLVDGSVRRSDSRVRVTVRLARTSDGAQRWSETYDASVENLLQVQTEIATAVGRALELSVTRLDQQRLGQRRNAEAYELYLRGLHAADPQTREGLDAADADFRRAMDIDPGFAEAQEMLALTHLIQAIDEFVEPEPGFARVRADAERLLQRDPNSSVAHGILCRIDFAYSWEWSAAERECNIAFAIDPHNAVTLYQLGELAIAIGEFERAEHLFREILTIDPLNADPHVEISSVLLRLGRLTEAEAEARRALTITPTFVSGHYQLGRTLLAERGFQEALDAFQQEAPEAGQQAGVAMALHALGRQVEAAAVLGNQARDYAPFCTMGLAEAYAYLGDTDRAFECLESIYRRHDLQLYYLKSEWPLSRLEKDGRYKALLRKMNLPG